MTGLLLDLALTLAVAASLFVLLERRGLRPSRPQLWAGFALLAVFCAYSLDWSFIPLALGPGQFPEEPGLPEILGRTVLGASLGAASFFMIRRACGQAVAGACAGLLFTFLGYWASRWVAIGVALSFMAPFWAWLLISGLSFALALSFWLAALALLHEDFRPHRLSALGVLILLWSLPAALSELYLGSTYDYGAKSLSEAAGVAAPQVSPVLSVVWLKPYGRAPYHFERKKMATGSVDLSVESLRRIERYMKERSYRSLFAREALAALREGWRLWWQADEALRVDSIWAGRRLSPNYRGALSILRAGPLELSRYQRLQNLANIARAHPRDSFEEVAQAQHIFEAFSAAYAHFGDEKNAREWLLKIDGLWPIYEKKIEVTPLENMHDGAIAGRLLLDGRPATTVEVGLFEKPATTGSTGKPSSFLSGSAFPDEKGWFHFDSLGPGNYYLGLQAPGSQLSGRIRNSPGIIELTRAKPVARLSPILIERR